MTIDAQIEAILFFKAEPIKTLKLGELLGVDEEVIRQELAVLSEKLEGRGVALLLKDDEVSLATIADAGDIIEKMVKDELHRDLGKGAIETLTIILYKGPIQKTEIDFIRGVNSNFILRNLLVRGLVEKIPHPTDQRSFLYRPTFDLLAYLGINKIEDLPEFEEFREKVEESMEQFTHKDHSLAEEVKHEDFPISSEQDQDEETAKFLEDNVNDVSAGRGL